jgi:multiple sugar transport system substrate-binding protein
LTRNPIATYEALVRGDAAYCPFAYGYSNYARPTYAATTLTFGNLVHWEDGRQLRSTLGGTGLAISQQCQHIDIAVDYARMRSRSHLPSQFVFHQRRTTRAPWCLGISSSQSAMCNDFFVNTLHTLDNAYLQPRYNGYLHFQDEAGRLCTPICAMVVMSCRMSNKSMPYIAHHVRRMHETGSLHVTTPMD